MRNGEVVAQGNGVERAALSLHGVGFAYPRDIADGNIKDPLDK